ncbi:MAG TPA: hypothetical protein VKF36_24035, partial [Syntrophorhabdales bacterium]|nr:hypothetical protein [Syntrophorhabdales bacterium]
FATVVTSSDGVTWTANTLPIPSEPIFGIAYGNDLFVAVGAHDFGGVLLSSDGLNWTPMWGLFNINLGSIAYGDGTFVADRGEGSAAILSSQDGKSWTLIHQGHPWLDYSPVIFGNHTFMVGTNPYGDIYQSDPINQPPVALCQNVTVNAGSACTAPASIDKGSYEPNGDPVTLTQAPAGPYPLGTTTPVTLTVTDSKPPSSQSQCAGTVTVQDKTPPTITMASVSPSVLWPPNHKMVDVTVNYTSIDNCSSQPTCTISGVTSNEPISSSDYSIVDPHHVKLSADRLGSGNGRIYTISIACTDASGNPSTQTVAVSVPHDQGKN